MKKITFILATLALLSTMSVSAQTTKPTTDQRVAALEKEVKTLSNDNRTIKATVADLENRLSQLSDRNAEYKKELDIRQVVDTMDCARESRCDPFANLKVTPLQVTFAKV